MILLVILSENTGLECYENFTVLMLLMDRM